MPEEKDEGLGGILKDYTADGLICSVCYVLCRNPLILTCMHSFCKRCETSCTPAKPENNLAGFQLRKCPICSLPSQTGCPDLVRFEGGQLRLLSTDKDVTSPSNQKRAKRTFSPSQERTEDRGIDGSCLKPTITDIVVIRSLDDTAKVKITWAPCPGAYLYRTKFSTTQDSNTFRKEITFQQLKDPTSTTTTIDGLRHNFKYSISLQAVYIQGMSDFGQQHHIITPQKVNRTACVLSIENKAMRIFVDSQLQNSASNCYTWNDEKDKSYDFFDRGRLLSCRGVTGNTSFIDNACEYWEVVVTLLVKQRPRAKIDIFCIGVVEEDKMDECCPLSRNTYSAGCSLYKVPYKPSLALTWWNGGSYQETVNDKELLHLHDAIYKTKTVTLGFLLDMQTRTLHVVDVTRNELLQIMGNIKFTKCLPIFELFDDKTADIEMKYVTGNGIEKLPTVLSGEAI